MRTTSLNMKIRKLCSNAPGKFDNVRGTESDFNQNCTNFSSLRKEIGQEIGLNVPANEKIGFRISKAVSSEGGSRQRLDKRMKEKRHDKYKIKSNAKKQVCVNVSGNDKLVPRRAQKRGEKSILFVRSFEKNLKRHLRRRSNVFSVTSTMRPLIRPKFNLSKRTNWSEKMDTGR